jgi:hypothetical protein
MPAPLIAGGLIAAGAIGTAIAAKATHPGRAHFVPIDDEGLDEPTVHNWKTTADEDRPAPPDRG